MSKILVIEDEKSSALRLHKLIIKHTEFKNFKIESDDIKTIANSINQPFKKTEELIRMEVKKKLKLK